MDEVHEMRDQFAADVVLLVRSGFGANAWLMSTVSADFEASGFATTKADCLTFAHELGHLMGFTTIATNARTTPAAPAPSPTPRLQSLSFL